MSLSVSLKNILGLVRLPGRDTVMVMTKEGSELRFQ